MAKRLSQMENSYGVASVFTVMCIFLASCGNGEMKATQNDSTQGKTVNQSNVSFVPDTTVNSVLILNNEQSLSGFVPNGKGLTLTNYLRETPVIIFLNKGKDEFLLAYQYEGGTKNSFSAFEIGYVKDLKQKAGVVTSYEHFSTESGLKLGDSISKVLSIKGTGYLNKSDTTLVYEISDYQKSDFLKFHNMPAYSFHCSMVQDKITGIRYGFVQP